MILIDVEMPQNCSYCFCENRGICRLTGLSTYGRIIRPDNCPLKKVSELHLATKVCGINNDEYKYFKEEILERMKGDFANYVEKNLNENNMKITIEKNPVIGETIDIRATFNLLLKEWEEQIFE